MKSNGAPAGYWFFAQRCNIYLTSSRDHRIEIQRDAYPVSARSCRVAGLSRVLIVIRVFKKILKDPRSMNRTSRYAESIAERSTGGPLFFPRSLVDLLGSTDRDMNFKINPATLTTETRRKIARPCEITVRMRAMEISDATSNLRSLSIVQNMLNV